MAFCTQCGSPVDDNSRFCVMCGAAVILPAGSSAPTAAIRTEAVGETLTISNDPSAETVAIHPGSNADSPTSIIASDSPDSATTVVSPVGVDNPTTMIKGKAPDSPTTVMGPAADDGTTTVIPPQKPEAPAAASSTHIETTGIDTFVTEMPTEPVAIPVQIESPADPQSSALTMMMEAAQPAAQPMQPESRWPIVVIIISAIVIVACAIFSVWWFLLR